MNRSQSPRSKDQQIAPEVNPKIIPMITKKNKNRLAYNPYKGTYAETFRIRPQCGILCSVFPYKTPIEGFMLQAAI